MSSCLFRFGARGGTRGLKNAQQGLWLYHSPPQPRCCLLNAAVVPYPWHHLPALMSVVTHHSRHIVSMVPCLFPLSHSLDLSLPSQHVLLSSSSKTNHLYRYKAFIPLDYRYEVPTGVNLLAGTLSGDRDSFSPAAVNCR